MRRILVVGLSVIALANPLASRGLSGGPVDGQVLDVETGAPIAGAFVVARWEGVISAIAESRTICAHVETAVSDAQGRYHVNVWTQAALVPRADVTLDAYKAGYESTSAPLGFNGRPDGTWVVYPRGRPHETLQIFHDEESARAATLPNNVYMKRFAGTPSQRFRFLGYRVFGGMNCINADASRRNLYPLQVAAYHEAKTLAATVAERNSLRGMREIAKSSWLHLPLDAPDRPDDRFYPPEVERDLE